MPIADTYVDASRPTKVFGTTTVIEAGNNPVRQAFLRFSVSGVGGRTVTSARLRLTVGSKTASGSDSGGTVHRITDDSWSEAATNYNNRPAIDGPGLATQGPVAVKQVVEFPLTGTVTSDGTYDFAIDSASGDPVSYRPRESATGKPELILTLE